MMQEKNDISRRISRIEGIQDNLKDNINTINSTLLVMSSHVDFIKTAPDRFNNIDKELLLKDEKMKDLNSLCHRLSELEARNVEFNGTVKILKWTASAIGASLFAVLTTVMSGHFSK